MQDAEAVNTASVTDNRGTVAAGVLFTCVQPKYGTLEESSAIGLTGSDALAGSPYNSALNRAASCNARAHNTTRTRMSIGTELVSVGPTGP